MLIVGNLGIKEGTVTAIGESGIVAPIAEMKAMRAEGDSIQAPRSEGGANPSVPTPATPAPLPAAARRGTPTPPLPPHTSGLRSAHPRVLPASGTGSRGAGP